MEAMGLVGDHFVVAAYFENFHVGVEFKGSRVALLPQA